MAPSGIQMLLKTIGFDPIAFRDQVMIAKDEALKIVAHFDQRLVAIENRLAAIEAANGTTKAVAPLE